MALSKLSRSVRGSVVIITGAASGMGRATARLFADEGARLALIDITPLDEVVGEMREAGCEVESWHLDLSDTDKIEKVITEIGEHYSGIDILINNAGISIPVSIDAPNFIEVWSKTLAILLTAHTATIRAALPMLRKADHPRIINIASTEALGASKGSSPYTAAKSGVVGLTRSLAVELGGEAITVNCVCPGPINTGMTEEIADEHKIIFAKRRAALRRYGEPEEVAHGILSLALPASQYITGVSLPIDGGLTIRNA